MTTSLDTLVVPVRYYTALDPYNWKVDNRPISDLEDNDDVLRSGIETTLNAVKTGAAIDGRILRSLVGLDKASGDWTLHPSEVTITLTDLIKGSVVSDDGFDVGVIAAQYSPAVFALATPAAGLKNLVTISAIYKLPSPADMPYYDSTQGLDALMTNLATAQTKQGTLEFAIATSTVEVGDPDNYFVPSGGYQALFNIKILETDTVLDPSRVLAVGITKHGQAVAKATNTTYGQVRFATGTEVTTGTSTDTVVSPADLATRALLEGDPAVNFQVEDAVDPKDAVNLGQMVEVINNLTPSYSTIHTAETADGDISGTIVLDGYREVLISINSAGGFGGGSGNNGGGGGGGGGGAYLVVLLRGKLDGYQLAYSLKAVNSSPQSAVPAYGHHDGDNRINNPPSILTVYSHYGSSVIEAIFTIGTGQSGEQGDGETDGGELSHGGRGGIGGVMTYTKSINTFSNRATYEIHHIDGGNGADGATNTGVGGDGGIQIQGCDSENLPSNPSGFGIGGAAGPSYTTVGLRGGYAAIRVHASTV